MSSWARLGIVLPAALFGLGGCAINALRVDYAGDVAAKGKLAAAASREFLVKVDATRVAANVDLIAIDPACVPDEVYTLRVPLLKRFKDVDKPPRGWLCSRERVPGVTQDDPLSLAPLDRALEPTFVLIDALGAYSAAITEILDGRGADPKDDLDSALDLARSAEGLLRSIAGPSSGLKADDPRLSAVGKFAGFLLDLRAEAEKAKALQALVNSPEGSAGVIRALRGHLAIWELSRRDDENRRFAFSRLLLDVAQASEPPLPVRQRRAFARAFYERAAARTTAAELKPALDRVLKDVGDADADLRRVLAEHPHLNARERRKLARITRERVARGFDAFTQVVMAFKGP